jgi:hypothetical protein
MFAVTCAALGVFGLGVDADWLVLLISSVKDTEGVPLATLTFFLETRTSDVEVHQVLPRFFALERELYATPYTARPA